MKIHRITELTAIVLGLLGSAPAYADAEDPCSTASGVGTHACIFPEGQVVVETNLVDRTIDDGGPLRTRSVMAGDTLVHVGISHAIEALIGWTPYDYERTEDQRVGRTTVSRGVGDVTIGGKVALLTTADYPIGIALQPTIEIGLGQRTLGASGVGGGLLLPLDYDLSDALTIELTPEGDYTGDRADNGRHLEYGGTVGLDWTISEPLSATIEYSALRDRDPAFHRTKQVVASSIAWKALSRLQLNAGYGIGVTRQSPKGQLMVGFAVHLF